MDNANQVPVSETAARRMGPTKVRRGRPCKDSARDDDVVQEPAVEATVADETATVETVRRARSLLLATLRIWELKQGIRE